MSKLPETQRRRLLLYFFGELSYEQIAKLEGCTKMAVKGSVDIALKKLKNFLKNFNFSLYETAFK
ncbi:MAG: RNA polymerase sigma factor [Lachnospirales bacterium]